MGGFLFSERSCLLQLFFYAETVKDLMSWGWKSFFSPIRVWVYVPSTVTSFPAEPRGVAETSIKVSTILQVTRAKLSVDEHLLPYFWPCSAFKPAEDACICIFLATSWPNVHNCYSSGEWSCNEQQESCLRPPAFTYCKWHASFFPSSPFEATQFQSI